ncbi:hypothetical protein BGW37DRAFT_470922 [Umbelopsis sp. PMI_123]|nr:hypothetical protein BGW37DRAFT_470922 [Umbelopsis sp. PMI_123]
MSEPDPWDDWETAADAQLNDYHPPPPNDDHEKNKKIWTEANAFAVPQIIRQDTAKSSYSPEIKILKRPTNPGSTTATPPSAISKKDVKTLEEREASYQATRRKIFGDDTPSRDTQNTQKRLDGGRQSESPQPVASHVRQPIAPSSENARGFGSQTSRPPRRL